MSHVGPERVFAERLPLGLIQGDPTALHSHRRQLGHRPAAGGLDPEPGGRAGRRLGGGGLVHRKCPRHAEVQVHL